MDPTNWQPAGPDYLPPSPRLWDLATAAQPAPPGFVPPLDLLATLSFQPAGPDYHPQRHAPVELPGAASLFDVLMPLNWAPVSPPWRAPVRRLGALAATLPPVYFLEVAASLTWQAQAAPPPAHRPLAARLGLPPGWMGDPGSLASDPGSGTDVCVDLGLEGSGVTTLTAATLALPTCLGEGLDTTGLVDEDVC